MDQISSSVDREQTLGHSFAVVHDLRAPEQDDKVVDIDSRYEVVPPYEGEARTPWETIPLKGATAASLQQPLL